MGAATRAATIKNRKVNRKNAREQCRVGERGRGRLFAGERQRQHRQSIRERWMLTVTRHPNQCVCSEAKDMGIDWFDLRGWCWRHHVSASALAVQRRVCGCLFITRRTKTQDFTFRHRSFMSRPELITSTFTVGRLRANVQILRGLVMRGMAHSR